MKRILVTGGCGFLGGHLVAALEQRGDEVIVVGRDKKPQVCFWSESPYAIIYGDCQDLALMRRVITEYTIDTVVHLAAQTQVSVGQENPEGMIRENVNGALAVLEACRLHGVKKVVVASTDKVYGESDDAYHETTPLLERNAYGVSKACVDMVAQTYLKSFGLPVAITRCGNLYGPGHMNWSTLIPGTIRRVHRCESPVLRFGGKATRDFLHIDDAVQAYLCLIDSDACGPFNFSGRDPRTILNIVELIMQHMELRLKINFQESGAGEIKAQALNCARARDVLGWTSRVGFEDGLRRTVKWYQQWLSSTTA